jgi:hypothetical protein
MSPPDSIASAITTLNEYRILANGRIAVQIPALILSS